MLLEELTQLSDWLRTYEKEYGAIKKIQQLHQLLNTNINSNPRQPFTDQKNAAVDAIRRYRFSELSRDQIECLKLHGGYEYMGPDAADMILQLFRDEGHDIAYLANKISEAHKALSNTNTQITKAAEAVEPFVQVVTRTEYLTERTRFSIIFKDGVEVNNFTDLGERSKEWSDIMYKIGRALNIPANDFKILGARNGCLIIDLYMAAAAMPAIGIILYTCFDVIERFALNIRRLNTIVNSEMDDPDFQEVQQKIHEAGEMAFELKRIKVAKKIADEILDKSDNPPGDREEADAFLQSAIKKILNHLRKGGDLDAYVPPDLIEEGEESEEEEAEEVVQDRDKLADASDLIEKVRHKKLEMPEDLITLLEHFDFDDEEEGSEG